jgi:hypothetical protein
LANKFDKIQPNEELVVTFDRLNKNFEIMNFEIIDKETVRQDNEIIRQDNEAIRVSNEESREDISNQFSHKGSYDSTTQYKNRNIVNYQGGSYMCISDSIPIGTDPTNATYWRKITGFNFKDVYDTTVTYYYGDYIIDVANENLYMCVAETSLNDPLTDGAAWTKLISVADAVANANTSATNADTSAANADTATTNANNASDSANTAATSANDAATNANTAADSANTAATNANTEADRAQNLVDTSVHMADWASTTAYVTNNQVRYDGSSWRALRDNTGVTPVEGLDWTLVAQRGLDGEGSVSTVNNKGPDVNGNVDLIASDVGAETPTGAQDKVDELAGAGRTTETVKGNADAVAAHEAEYAQQMAKNQTRTATIPHGLSIIETDQQTGVEVKAEGRTLVNHMGWQGKFGSLFNRWNANLAIDTSVYKFGTSSGKIDNSAGTGEKYSQNPQKMYLSGKYILVGVWAKAVSGTPEIDALTMGYDLAGTFLSGQGTTLRKVIDNTWKFYYLKLDYTAKTANYWNIRLDVNTFGTVDDVVNFDGTIVNELTQAQYNEIDILTSDQVAEKYGYVDSVKHIQNPVFVSYGKNLSPTEVSGWEQGNISNIDGTNTTSSNRVRMTGYTPSIPNTAYALSFSTSYNMYIIEYDKDQKFTKNEGAWRSSPYTFTTSANTAFVRLIFRKPDDSAVIPIDVLEVEPQLELGSTATTFEVQNKTYLYGAYDSNENPISLGSNLDGSVADKLYYSDGWKVLKRWEKDVVLDDSLGWVLHNDQSGYKAVRVPITNGTGEHWVVKYDGKILKQIASSSDGSDGSTYASVSTTNDHILITIADTDSGWTEAMTPTANMIKGYFNGWKYTGDGTTHSWVSIVDGSASPTQTEAYVSANVASGFTPYSLNYQLADSVTEPVTLEGDLTLIDGLNQVSLEEGAVVRELVNPVKHTDGNYNINNTISSLSESKLKNRTNNILIIYKNGDVDNQWIIRKDRSDGYGGGNAYLHESKFDTTARYTVTSLVLDKHLFTANAESAEITYSTNLKTVVDKNVDKIAKITTKQSIQDIFNQDVAVKGEGEVVQKGSTNIVLSNQAENFKTISFPRAYASLPKIIATLESGDASKRAFVGAFSVTTTGFTLMLVTDDRVAVTWNRNINWIAIG